VHVSVFIDRAFDSVDPSETEGLLDGVVIRKVRFSSVFFQKDKPYLSLTGVILLQPGSPLPTVSRCISHRAHSISRLYLLNLWKGLFSPKLTFDSIQPLRSISNLNTIFPDNPKY